MPPRILKRPQVIADLNELASYIAIDNLEAAESFLTAAEETFKLLATMPMMGSLCRFELPEAAGVRFWRIKGFPKHLIFYFPLADGVDIIRIIYGTRNIEAILTDELK